MVEEALALGIHRLRCMLKPDLDVELVVLVPVLVLVLVEELELDFCFRLARKEWSSETGQPGPLVMIPLVVAELEIECVEEVPLQPAPLVMSPA